MNTKIVSCEQGVRSVVLEYNGEFYLVKLDGSAYWHIS